jgi:hypothetical protein
MVTRSLRGEVQETLKRTREGEALFPHLWRCRGVRKKMAASEPEKNPDTMKKDTQ